MASELDHERETLKSIRFLAKQIVDLGFRRNDWSGDIDDLSVLLDQYRNIALADAGDGWQPIDTGAR